MRRLKKSPDVTGLVINTALNTKIGQVKNKFPDDIGLAANTALNTKIEEVKKNVPDDSNYSITNEFNKCSG